MKQQKWEKYVQCRGGGHECVARHKSIRLVWLSNSLYNTQDKGTVIVSPTCFLWTIERDFLNTSVQSKNIDSWKVTPWLKTKLNWWKFVLVTKQEARIQYSPFNWCQHLPRGGSRQHRDVTGRCWLGLAVVATSLSQFSLNFTQTKFSVWGKTLNLVNVETVKRK